MFGKQFWRGRKNSLSFDFNRAVAAARRDYPEETQDVTFIESSSTKDAVNRLAEWLELASPEFKERAMGESTAEEAADLCIFISDGVMCMSDHESGRGILIIPGDPAENPFKILAPDISYTSASAFLFFHELGHLVIEDASASAVAKARAQGCDNGTIEKIKLKMEILADCFAIFSGLQAGALDKDNVRQFISFREEYQYGDPRHNTFQALQALIDKYKVKKVASMTPQTLRETAVAHAMKFVPEIVL